MVTCATYTLGPASIPNASWSTLASGLLVPTGALTAAVSFTVTVAGGGPHGGGGFQGAWKDASGAVVAFWPLHNVASGAIDAFTLTVPAAAVRFDLSVTAGPVANSNVATASVVFDCTSATECAYGTEVNPDAQVFSYVTGALVDSLALVMGWGPVVILAMDALIGAPLFAPTCDNPPPAVPDITDASFLGNLQHLEALLANALWHFYCRCTPAPGGSPPAIPYAPPTLPPEFTTGPQPPLTCNNEDLCATLNDIVRQLVALNASLLATRRDVTLLQRQHVPFAYLTGRVHAGLFDQGYLNVQGILGLSVLCTTVPAYLSDELGAPDEHRFLGHVSFGSADGFERRVTLTHATELILGVSGAVTQIGYSFAGGVVATITELVREP